MAHAELVEDVRVRGREVGDRVVGEDQPLEHRLVDQPADQLLVGAQRLELGLADRRREQVRVDGVEVDRAAAPVGLGPNGITTKQSGARPEPTGSWVSGSGDTALA